MNISLIIAVMNRAISSTWAVASPSELAEAAVITERLQGINHQLLANVNPHHIALELKAQGHEWEAALVEEAIEQANILY